MDVDNLTQLLREYNNAIGNLKVLEKIFWRSR